MLSGGMVGSTQLCCRQDQSRWSGASGTITGGVVGPSGSRLRTRVPLLRQLLQRLNQVSDLRP